MSDEYFVKSEYYDDGVRFGTGSEMIAEVKRLRSELEASRHRVAELEDRLKRFLELINLREWTLQGSPEEILEAFRRARATLEGKHPNAESLAAMQELEDGGGETFSSVDDLMKDLESDD
jgi:hypothetical protein